MHAHPLGRIVDVTCCTHARRVITEKEISDVSNAVFNWTLLTYNKVNIDKIYERRIGEQLEQRFPYLPDRGSTAGVDRDWKHILHWVFHNRRKGSAARMYQRHSIHIDAVTDECKRLIEKGLKVNTHKEGDALFEVMEAAATSTTSSRPKATPSEARRLSVSRADDENQPENLTAAGNEQHIRRQSAVKVRVVSHTVAVCLLCLSFALIICTLAQEKAVVRQKPSTTTKKRQSAKQTGKSRAKTARASSVAAEHDDEGEDHRDEEHMADEVESEADELSSYEVSRLKAMEKNKQVSRMKCV